MEAELLKGLEAALAEAEEEYAALAQAMPQLATAKGTVKRSQKATETQGRAVPSKTTFGTSRRPEPKPKPGQNAAFLVPNLDCTKKRVAGGALPTAPKETKTVKQDSVPLFPNYDLTLKKPPAAVISTPVTLKRPKAAVETQQIEPLQTLKVTVPHAAESLSVAQKTEKKVDFKTPSASSSLSKRRYNDTYEIDESQNSVSTAASEYEDFFKAKSEWDQSAKQWAQGRASCEVQKLHFKAAPAPVKTAIGPGAHTPNYAFIERSAGGVKFTQSSRQGKPLEVAQTPLTPNIDAVKWKKPSAVIIAPGPKPEALLKKRAEEEEDAHFAALMNLATAAGPKDALKPRVVGGVIDRFEEDEQKPDPDAKLGPGRYFVSYSAVEEAVPGAVKYHVPLGELAPKPAEKLPGPGEYDPDDLATRADPREAFFGEEKRSKSPEPDMRRALNPNEALLHPQAPRPHIDPEHISVLPPDFSQRIGPGEYDPSHRLVELRADIGVVPFTSEAEKPPVVDNRVLLFPDVELQHPNHLVFQYHEPTVVQPPHVPESELFPGQWRFYDASVDNRFDRAPEVDFARGIEQGEYRDEEEKKDMELRHIARMRATKLPPVGAYDPEPVLERAPAYDFGKVAPRDPDAGLDSDAEPLEGDVLVLNPTIKEHVPMLVDMKRDAGRPEDSISLDKEELVLDPHIDAVRPKIAVLVNMEKETGRKEREVDLDEGQALVLDPRPVEPRPIVLVDMSKQKGRSVEQSLEEDLFMKVNESGAVMVAGGGGNENLLKANDDVLRRKVPMFVNMEKQTGRDLDQSSEQSLVLMPEPVALVDPTKPRVLGVLPFDRTTGREEVDAQEPEAVLSHPTAVPEVLKSYKSTLPDVRVAAFDRYAPRWDEEEEVEEGKKVHDYS